MPKTRFAVVGCGHAALPVCAALAASALAALSVVYDQDQALAADLAQRYGVTAAPTLDAALTSPQVDAVYLAVPHDRLAPLARLALEAGKPALVEKPLAITLADADALIALAAANGLALGVFYELRHHAAIAQARALVQAGVIGVVQSVRLQTLIDKPLSYWEAGYAGRSRNPWRGRKAQAGGGVVLMNSSHLLDAAAYITGLEVARVSAEAGARIAPVEVEDSAVAVLRYTNGALGSLHAGAHLPGARLGDERFDIYGTEGALRLPDPYGADPLLVYARRAWPAFGLAAGEWTTLELPPAAIFSAAVEAFARAVQTGAPAPTSGHDARRVLAIVLALYQSAAEGRAISLQERSTHEHL
ncbi:MAG: Gfo/Idh/MocA family oxidoreductase [Anaerolineales bacterium]|nr:Gfo/Idh/MocA family oxidoreductase [Anaerolineales bacterium]